MPKTRLTAALCSSKTTDTATTQKKSDGPAVPPDPGRADPSDKSSPIQLRFQSLIDPNMSADMESDSTDSDEDLPELSLDQASKPIPEKGDPVWVKYRQHNFWPSLVLQSNQKTRKLRILFLDQLNGQDTTDLGEKIYMKYNKKNVVPFTAEKRKQFEADGKALSGDLRKRFLAAMSTMDDYLTKRALGLADAYRIFLNDSASSAAEDESEKQQSEHHQPPQKNGQDKQVPQEKQKQKDEDASDQEMEEGENGDVSTFCPADTTTSNKNRKRKLNPDERRELRKGRNEPLVEYICSKEMKEYLVKIFKGTVPSDRHQAFNKGVSQQNKLQYNSLGPIDDDEQLDRITENLGGWLSEAMGQPIPNSSYLFGVWLPEAIVKAIVKVRRISRQRAWEVFNQGVRLVKCERLEIHNSLIKKT